MKTNLNFHPLIENVRKTINKSNLEKGCIIGRRTGLDIRVSPDSLDRALSIMDRLFKAFEKKGIAVDVKKGDYKHITNVTVSGVVLEIDLYEKIKINKKGQDRFGFNQLEYIPIGELVLRIKNSYWNLRSQWADGRRKKVEDFIDSFIDGLYKTAAKEKELEKERLQWKEDQRRLDEEKVLKELEQERFNKLVTEAMNWQKSQVIKSYIEAATKVYIQKNGNVEPGSEFDQWKIWANDQANQLDPLEKQFDDGR